MTKGQYLQEAIEHHAQTVKKADDVLLIVIRETFPSGMRVRWAMSNSKTISGVVIRHGYGFRIFIKSDSGVIHHIDPSSSSRNLREDKD